MDKSDFQAYLIHLGTYQSVIIAAIICGLLIAFGGMILAFRMRSHSGEEKFKFATEKGTTFNFSSTFSGGLVAFSGAGIVVCALIAIMVIAPKIKYTKNGWSDSSALTMETLIRAVAENQAVLARLHGADSQKTLTGILVGQRYLAKTNRRPDELVEIERNQVEGKGTPDEIWNQGKAYFIPLEKTNSHSTEASEIRNQFQANDGKYKVEALGNGP